MLNWKNRQDGVDDVLAEDINNIANELIASQISIDQLKFSKQDKLTAGDNITIDENNVISAVGGGASGANGKDGFSPIVEITETEQGHDISITDANGTKTFSVKDGVNGQDGTDGKDGYTPIKGVDYFDGAKGDKGDKGDKGESGEDYVLTDEDKVEIADIVTQSEIVGDIDAALDSIIAIQNSILGGDS